MDTRTSIDLVVVTGGTGHVGAMVIHQLLNVGYSVRATARPTKVDTLKDTHPNANGRLEVVEMNDLVADAGKWPEILQGVDAVIHVAAPVYHPGTTSEYIYASANVGTQKLLDAVAQSSVKRFVLTSPLGVFFNPDFSSLFDHVVYDHNTWSPLEDFDPKEHDPSYAYIASKITSEKLVWKAADKSPQIDFTTILPSTVYGWFLKNYPVPKSVSEFNANKFLYQLIEKGVRFPEYPLTDLVHNRDVAKAHVLALTAPVLPKGQRKRFIVSQGNMTWVQAIAFLQEPETVEKFRAREHDILSRLPDVSMAGMQSQFKVDRTLTESVLGMKQEDYVPWQEILLEVVPAMMDWEQSHSDLVC
ncbi:NAD dependent epimerase/dehydratase [Favolaschia claudopus]|uniref:NAD dependent epimerase/dehydratase n=1 Tax=Favolaschia claudopus TaxID=2862362 RepID=A0AAW0BK92_9AGAR